MSEAGKGDSPRPRFVSPEEFDFNWEQTFGIRYASTCSECNGKGILVSRQDDIPFDSATVELCEHCNGSGVDDGKNPI